MKKIEEKLNEQLHTFMEFCGKKIQIRIFQPKDKMIMLIALKMKKKKNV